LEKINEKKRKNRKVEKKNLKKKNLKKKKKKRKKLTKKKEEKNTMDYCCNPQCFVCGGTVIPPHDLDIVVILGISFNFFCII
jgi:hypothetical protein